MGSTNTNIHLSRKPIQVLCYIKMHSLNLTVNLYFFFLVKRSWFQIYVLCGSSQSLHVSWNYSTPNSLHVPSNSCWLMNPSSDLLHTVNWNYCQKRQKITQLHRSCSFDSENGTENTLLVHCEAQFQYLSGLLKIVKQPSTLSKSRFKHINSKYETGVLTMTLHHSDKCS